ncbi:hypothetical protein KIL84_019640 [Mauremys mutica]|uniref:Uncharacterized protein n=1 Tax=Mauremys mutica TaxID=74926 RepID=A0A9D3XWS2_9SAUR|nr:hypothetical protein KIL84_019640 [Mauremys mutica]
MTVNAKAQIIPAHGTPCRREEITMRIYLWRMPPPTPKMIRSQGRGMSLVEEVVGLRTDLGGSKRGHELLPRCSVNQLRPHGGPPCLPSILAFPPLAAPGTHTFSFLFNFCGRGGWMMCISHAPVPCPLLPQPTPPLSSMIWSSGGTMQQLWLNFPSL